MSEKKFCVNCVHFETRKGSYCDSPRAPKHPIRGDNSLAPCDKMRGLWPGKYSIVLDEGKTKEFYEEHVVCGVNGSWFEEKEEQKS
ncbi:MAG TPA: hypothetical protein ENI27_00990 [bacterium]|nr:hypothetical protein [bacterium]